MKKLGIIGGIGWPSTLDYYRTVCQASHLYHGQQGHAEPLPTPEIAIESLNMEVTVNNRGGDEPESWQRWDSYFQQALQRLEASGAEVVVIASVTPHTRLTQLASFTQLPIISIFDSTGRFCVSEAIPRLLILGTKPTMQSNGFISQLAGYGINAQVPLESERQDEIVDVIDELYQGRSEGAGNRICAIVRKILPAQQLASTVVCLGCTELAGAFPEATDATRFTQQGIDFLNLTRLHALSAFAACLDFSADNT